MKYDEKDIEEFLNGDVINGLIQLQSQVSTIIGILVAKNMITMEQFNKTKKEIEKKTKDIIKDKIKVDLV